MPRTRTPKPPNPKTFRPMDSAPRDGTVVEVKHGPQQETVRAYWSGQNQAFVRDDDPNRKTLHQVTEWRPVRK